MDGQKSQGDLDDDIDADEYRFGFDLLPGGSNRFASVLLLGPGSVDCADRFTNLLRDLTSECTGVRRREGKGTKGTPRTLSLFYASADDVTIPAEGGMVM